MTGAERRTVAGEPNLPVRFFQGTWGSTHKTSCGYVMAYMPEHPRANGSGEVPEHTVVLEAKLGRYLRPNEVAHHINHVRDDNRPENLELMDVREHCLMHLREAAARYKAICAARPPKAARPGRTDLWSEEDLLILKQNWTQDDKDLGQLLERSRAAVRAKRAQLGLVGKPAKTGTAWLEQEQRYLTDNWGICTAPEIAETLGRTVTAVKLKAKRLHLGGQMTSGEMLTARSVASLLGVDGHTVLGYWVTKCGLWAKPRRWGAGDEEVYVIRLPDLLSWMQAHQSLWDSRRLSPGALGPEPPWLTEKRASDLALPARRCKKWTPEEDSQLAAMIASGMTCRESGEALGRSEEAAFHRAWRLGLSRRRMW